MVAHCDDTRAQRRRTPSAQVTTMSESSGHDSSENGEQDGGVDRRTEDEQQGGRWDKTPYRADDLRETYDTTESGRLDVQCPGCGNNWFPSSKCCVNRYAGSPFCPECGTDFRDESATFEPVVKFWDVDALTARSSTPDEVTGAVRSAMEALEADDPEQALKTLRGTFGDLEAVTRSGVADAE